MRTCASAQNVRPEQQMIKLPTSMLTVPEVDLQGEKQVRTSHRSRKPKEMKGGTPWAFRLKLFTRASTGFVDWHWRLQPQQ